MERFLDKFHQPSIPSHTIITDPEYFVFLWFHNANGQLIRCPYLEAVYENAPLKRSSVDFLKVNASFDDHVGIQGGTENTYLSGKCFDLTPFVRQIQLPEIKPANADTFDTLFG